MSNNTRQYTLTRKLVNITIERLKILEHLTTREQDIYIRGLRDGFKLCEVEMLAALDSKK